MGEEHYSELAINYYASSQIKLSLGYTLRNGNSGYYDLPGRGNNYFEESGLPYIRRGDFIGIGLIFSL